MTSRPIEGVMIAAILKGSAFGQRAYSNVTLRRRDGSEQKLGGLMVADALGEVLAPGREGRFYLHDVIGTKGLHAFTPVGGTIQIAFPKLVERVFAVLALLNLAMVAAWIALDAALPIVPLMIGVLATGAWATCRGCREAVLHDLKYENQVAAARNHRSAVMRSHA